MGFLDSVTGSLFGGSKQESYQTPLLPRPERPLTDLTSREEAALADLYESPETSREFVTGQALVHDTAARTGSRLVDEIDRRMGAPEGPGLQTGASVRAVRGGLADVGQASTDAIRQLYLGLLDQRSNRFLQLLQILSNFEVGATQAQAAGIGSFSKGESSPGFIGGLAGAIGDIGQGLGGAGSFISAIG